MSSMSTPVASLPRVDSSNTQQQPSADPVVADVLEEMEREVAAAEHQSAPVHQQASMQQAAPYAYSGQQMMMPPPPMYTKAMGAQWIDTGRLQTAIAATVIAMVLLLPKLPNIYERFSRIAFLEPYETYVRAALLALVLYIAMVKLNI